MTPHGRKYRDSDSHPLPLWSGIMEHCGRIGSALWEFVWIIDKITEERDGIGTVLGGAPVRIRQIATDLDRGEHTIRRNLDRLEDERYIERTRTPYGFVIKVRNSYKFQIWSQKKNVITGRSLPNESVQKRPFCPTNLADLTVKNGRNKEDATEDATEDAARRIANGLEFWNLIGVSAVRVPPAFRELCEGLYHTENGHSLPEFMGACMDAWEGMGNKRQPRAFAKAASELRNQQRTRPPGELVAVLKDEEWEK